MRNLSHFHEDRIVIELPPAGCMRSRFAAGIYEAMRGFGHKRTRRAESVCVERVSARQAAAILGLPPRTIQDRAARGEIAGAAKLGRRWTFDVKALRRIVKQKERETWQSAERPQDVFGGARPFGAGLRFAGENSDGRFTRVTRRLRAQNSRPRGSG
jgi:Helix-turn-helix domain